MQLLHCKCIVITPVNYFWLYKKPINLLFLKITLFKNRINNFLLTLSISSAERHNGQPMISTYLALRQSLELRPVSRLMFSVFLKKFLSKWSLAHLVYVCHVENAWKGNFRCSLYRKFRTCPAKRIRLSVTTSAIFLL